ncbi:MAG: replicative DNA helicase [Ignavibacteria bacterium GWF2_33_9]|nr:MAG: replicative DNA helicase [Ignavibacteria bacterium GWF2_33_9]
MDEYEFLTSGKINTLPYSNEAEKAVLGAILISHRNVSRGIELLEADAFYNFSHKHIFESIQKLFEKNQSIDIVTVSEHLKNRGLLEKAGGLIYISDLAKNVANSANFEDYAKIIIEKHIKRSLIEASEQIITEARDESSDAIEEIDKAESRIFEIAEKRLKKSHITMKQLSKDAYSIIQTLRKGDLSSQSVATGYSELDHLLGGMHNSDLLILAARPSMGKTALALSIARNVAYHNIPVAFFSLEMSANQLVIRLISAEARVDQSSINRGTISNAEESQIVDSIGVLSNLPIFVDDSASMTIMELRAKSRRLKADHGVKLIIIDYLQLINSPKSESREREISMISRSLKQMAKELEVPVVALAQLNRLVENRPDKRPVLSDLRESGSIEQDADVVMFVNRPEYYKIKFFDKEQKFPTEGMGEIIIGKQRNGPTGSIKLAFLKKYARFENPSYDEPMTEFDESKSTLIEEDNYYAPTEFDGNDPGF